MKLVRRREFNSASGSMPRRTGMLTKITRLAGIAVFSCYLSSCGIYENQRLRINPDGVESVSAHELGLEKGKTTPAKAIARMKSRGMTGIKSDNAFLADKILDAVTADYQDKVHIFEEGLYSHSVSLNPGPGIPYDLGIRFGSFKNRLFLIAIYSDPVESIKNQHILPVPPKLESFEYKNGRFSRHGVMLLEKLSKNNNGVRDPFFVGWNMADGILFLARDVRGVVWRKAYQMRMVENGDDVSLRITDPVGIRKALGCSCVQDYVYGRRDR